MPAALDNGPSFSQEAPGHRFYFLESGTDVQRGSAVTDGSQSTKAADIQQIVDAEVARREPFKNWHGLTAENFQRFLVTPFEVLPDRRRTRKPCNPGVGRLAERVGRPRSGYLRPLGRRMEVGLRYSAATRG